MRPRHDCANSVALGKTASFEHEYLVVSFEADRLAQRRLRPALLVDDVADVGDLPAAGRVERRLVQLHLEGAVTPTVEGGDRREDVGLLVSDEVRLRALDLNLDRHRRA